MRALVCKQLGSFDIADPRKAVLVLADQSLPPLPDNGVRLRVLAASVNFADVLQIQGQYQEKPKLPFVPGNEVAGEVLEVGRDVRTLAAGDRVVALTNNGAFAEECVARENACLKLPDGVDVETAAGLPVAFGTAHVALHERARLQSGQVVLVLGAAGGVGVAAVQVAKAVGATVVALARGARKVDFLTKLGADAVIDTSQHKDLRRAIKAAAPAGVDVVFDPVGGAQFQDALKSVRWGAHILFIGFASGQIPKVAANVALVKNLTLHGVYWGSYLQHKPWILHQSLRDLLQMLAAGNITVHVSHRFPIEQYNDAFKTLLARQVQGKVLLLPHQPLARL